MLDKINVIKDALKNCYRNDEDKYEIQAWHFNRILLDSGYIIVEKPKSQQRTDEEKQKLRKKNRRGTIRFF